MKICVYGAGAVGGHIAARLGGSGAEVSVIARGEQLSAIREHGLVVDTRDGELHTRPVATDDPAALAPQDIVLVTVKAPALPSIAESLGAIVHPDTRVVFVTNGIPWWYFHAHGGPLDGTHLRRLDPDQLLWKHVGPQRSVGAVAYTACTVTAPGRIRAGNPRNRLLVGRPDGRPDAVLHEFAGLLAPSGLEVSITPKIRDAVWAKLSMNMIGGSLGVLSTSAMKNVLDKPDIATIAHTMALEGAAVAHALGCDSGDPEEGLRKLATSTHIQSVVQDLQAGRQMEIDALFRVPLELAELADVATPALRFVIGLAVQRARAAGLYRDLVDVGV